MIIYDFTNFVGCPLLKSPLRFPFRSAIECVAHFGPTARFLPNFMKKRFKTVFMKTKIKFHKKKQFYAQNLMMNLLYTVACGVDTLTDSFYTIRENG